MLYANIKEIVDNNKDDDNDNDDDNNNINNNDIPVALKYPGWRPAENRYVS